MPPLKYLPEQEAADSGPTPEDESPEATDLWALRRAISLTNPSPTSRSLGDTTAAEEVWELGSSDEAHRPRGSGGSQERASEADALARLVSLNEEFRARVHPEAPPATPYFPPSNKTQRAWSLGPLSTGKIIKSLLALAVAVALAWAPLMRLAAVTSAEAMINARLINLRAPIGGAVSIVAPSIAVGALVTPGETLLRVTNMRADRRGLDELRRTIDGLHTESTALDQRIGELKKTHGELTAQLDAFQKGRIRQLEARAAELASEVNATKAQYEDAKESFERSTKLKAKGYQTVATLLHAERDFKVAKTNIETAQERQQSNQVELDGARKGFFIGDSYNDRPRSAQRLDEVGQLITELTSQLEERKTRTTYLEKELADEVGLFAKRSKTDVTATVSARIWEVLTANGEDVQEGQDLLRILDCGGAVVTATVSESDYNELWIGQPATFQLRGETRAHPGTVVSLTGLTPASANFAIEQAALRREPYHATIAVPDVAAMGECNVGRTGLVTFDTSAVPKIATSAISNQTTPAVRRTKNIP